MVSQDPAVRRARLEWISAATRQGTATRMRTVLIVAIAAAFALTLSAAAVNATTYTVNTLQDTSGNGDCSLRDAINAANRTPTSGSTCTKAGGGRDTIQFSVTGTILLRSTLPQVTDSELAIAGPITIDGGSNLGIGIFGVQVMQVASGATLNLKRLTIADGFTDAAGGGILNFGTLTVTDSTFSGNFGGAGGGIGNGGTLTVTNSTFSNNSGGGSGIFNDNMLIVTNSTFSGNSGGVGGGINNSGTLTVSNSTFSGNSGVPGGGIANFGENGLTVTNTTFSNNSGGGIFSATSLNARPLNVTNSTFFGNFSNFFSSGAGGGILNFSGPASLIKSTIIAGSSGGNCYGTINDVGYNISDDATCGFANTGSAPNGDSVNPGLSSDGLTNNGGPTQTIALVPGSPAIDAIPFADCTDQASPPNRIITDQRGALRPDAGELLCDIGAYEFQDVAGQPNCHGKSVSALAHQFGNIKAVASALGFPSVAALQDAITISCGG